MRSISVRGYARAIKCMTLHLHRLCRVTILIHSKHDKAMSDS